MHLLYPPARHQRCYCQYTRHQRCYCLLCYCRCPRRSLTCRCPPGSSVSRFLHPPLPPRPWCLCGLPVSNPAGQEQHRPARVVAGLPDVSLGKGRGGGRQAGRWHLMSDEVGVSRAGCSMVVPTRGVSRAGSSVVVPTKEVLAGHGACSTWQHEIQCHTTGTLQKDLRL